jgi:hypothetical protein
VQYIYGRAVNGDPPDAYRTVQYVYGRVAVATWKLAVERLLDACEKPITQARLLGIVTIGKKPRLELSGPGTSRYEPRTDVCPVDDLCLPCVDLGAAALDLGEPGALELLGGEAVLADETLHESLDQLFSLPAFEVERCFEHLLGVHAPKLTSPWTELPTCSNERCDSYHPGQAARGRANHGRVTM